MRRVVCWFLFVAMMSARALAQPDAQPPPVVDPWAEDPPAEPPKPAEPPEPKREDPKPAKLTDPDARRPSLHTRWLRWRTLPPAKTNYDAAPFTGDPEPAALDIDPDRPPPRPYPRSFVERPLLLPAGRRQVSLSGNIGRETIGDFELNYAGGSLGALMGFDAFQLDVGMNLTLLHEDNLPDTAEPVDIPVLRRVYLGIHWRLPSETLIGVQGVLGNMGSDRQRYSPSLFVEHKFRATDTGAIYVTGGVDYNYGNESAYDDHYVTKQVGAWAGATARVQPTPLFAAQVSGSVGGYKFVDDLERRDDDYTVLAAGAALLFSVSESTDLITFFSVSSIEDLDTTSGGLSLAMR